MGVYLSTVSTETHPVDGHAGEMSYGASSMQGWRQHQEDAHNCCLDFDEETKTALFAVYDGHGGADVAEYASRHLPAVIKANQLYKDNKLPEALSESFLEFDKSLISKSVQDELKVIAGVDNVDTADEEEAKLLQEEAETPLEDVMDQYGGIEKVPDDVKEIMNRNKKLKKVAEADGNVVHGKSIENEINHKENGKLEDIPENKEAEAKVVNSVIKPNGEKEEKKDGKVEVDSSAAVKKNENGEKNGEKANSEEKDDLDEVKDEENEDEDDDKEEDDDEEDSEEGESGEEEDWSDTDSEEEGENDECDHGEMMTSTCEDEAPGYDSGCTAIVALVRDGQLHVANVGDSRCVLCRSGTALDLSDDHKPENETELARIKNAGGHVSFDGRVNGGLNLSRALGDHNYKTNSALELKDQMISGLPDVTSTKLEPGDEFAVLACDGIWNSLTSQEVVDFVKERVDNGVRLSEICDQLFHHCLAPDTTGDGTGCDNMTCIIVRFQGDNTNNSNNNASSDKNTDNDDKTDNTASSRAAKRSVTDMDDNDSTEESRSKKAKLANV